MPRLLVIVPDRISEILSKGEYQPCYYNPGQVFDEVHILTTTDDKPCLAELQKTVGDAKLQVHCLPEDPTIAGKWPEWLSSVRLLRWAKPGVELARQIQPALVRCHGADWNCYLASRIKKELGIPYVVSIHSAVNPLRRLPEDFNCEYNKQYNRFYTKLASHSIKQANWVMPVYCSIVPYLRSLGVSRYQVCYNVLDRYNLKQKTDYRANNPVRIVYVSRLIQGKNPDNIIRALVELPHSKLTIIGDGPLREHVAQLVSDLGLADRVHFRPSVLNDELCRFLVEQDIFAVHSEYQEISKSVLEALLTGLPVVINQRRGEAVPELEGNFVMKVENTTQGYLGALRRLLSDDQFRAEMGKKAFSHARARWSPEATEEKYAGIYRSFLRHSNGR